MPWEYDTSLSTVANHEIGAVLFSKGGRSDGVKTWEIRCKELIFQFKTSDQTICGGEYQNTPIKQIWHIISIDIPKEHHDKRDELLYMASKAMEAKGIGSQIKVDTEVTISKIFLNDKGGNNALGI